MSSASRTIRDLHLLLASARVKAEDADQLNELLRSATGSAVPPEVRKEELASRERRQASRQAHEEKLRGLEHAERLKAIELGQAFPDPETAKVLARVTRGAVGWAGCVALLVPPGLLGIAYAATQLLADRVEPASGSFLGLMGIIWGCAGAVALLTAILALESLSQRTLPTPRGYGGQKTTPVDTGETSS